MTDLITDLKDERLELGEGPYVGNKLILRASLIAALSAKKEAEGKLCKAREALLGDLPWSLRDVLERMIRMHTHLSIDHDCDHHGYETDYAARQAAERIIPKIEGVLRNSSPCRHEAIASRVEDTEGI